MCVCVCGFVCVYLRAAKSKRKIVASPFLKPNTIPFSEFLFPPFFSLYFYNMLLQITYCACL